MENTKNSNNFGEIITVRQAIRAFMGHRMMTSRITSDDYHVVYADQEFNYRYASFSEEAISRFEKIEPPQKLGSFVEISFDKLPRLLQKDIFSSLFPEGNEDEEYIFIYGPEKGLLYIEEKNWIKEHRLCDDDALTYRVFNEIGRWDQVKAFPMRGVFRLYKGNEVYKLRARQTIGQNGLYYAYSLVRVDLAAEAQAKKVFGRRARELADFTGVDFKIVSLLRDFEDPKALEALRIARTIRYNADKIAPKTCHELVACGFSRRVNAIKEVLGEYALLFRMDGMVKTTRLARYLAGKSSF